jgi:signal transduction histidine kinase/HAMP domain-containing protein
MPTVSQWAKRVAGTAFRLHCLNIGPRLTLCFMAIILAMLAGNAVLVWQFEAARRQGARLAGVDQELIVVLQAHISLMSVYERLDVLADSENALLLLKQVETLRDAVLQESQRTRNALTHLPPEVQLDPTLLPTLLATQGELPSQLDAIATLAKFGDWDGVHLRLANQFRPLESRSFALVENVDREVGQQRMQAVANIERAQRHILLIVPITTGFTLLFAAFLGLVITRSITQRLGRLVEGSTALARGDFSHRVPATGNDEITHLGTAFNDMIAKVQELYGKVQSRETYLAEAQKLSHTGSFGWDVFTGEIYWSEETFRIFEFEPNAKVTIDAILERIHPDDRAIHRKEMERVSRERSPFDVEHRLLMPDGRVKHLRVVGRHSTQEAERSKFVGAVTDITDRKRAESLLAGEKRILEMVAKGDSLSQILDSLCRLAEELASGVLPSVLLVDGDRLRHGGAPSLPQAYTAAINGAMIGPSVGFCGEEVTVEDIAIDSLWANYRDLALPHSLRAYRSIPIFSSQGKVIAIFALYDRELRAPIKLDQGIIEQISHLAGVAIERKLTQEALRRSEAYLAEAQRLTHTGSWAWNLRTNELFWSQELCCIYALDPQMKPTWPWFLNRVHPEDRTKIEQQAKMESTEKDWTVSEIEFRVVMPDKTVKHIHAISYRVTDDSGDTVEVMGTVMDVTQRKHAEAERERFRQLEADLAHTSRVSMMGELAASLAHEIRQPITAAMTNARTSLRWLQRNPPDIDEARETISRAVSDVNRAAEIISHLRSLYKKDSATERELVDVNEVAREMLTLLRSEAHRFSISMRTELAADLPKTKADRVQLQQVFMNLMLNAVDAMKDMGGELTLKTQLVDDSQLLISVSDTGLGLPTEKVEQIFSAFFTTKVHGTGMGLSISRTIVESHGGRLWAIGNSGRGATFHFTLQTAA